MKQFVKYAPYLLFIFAFIFNACSEGGINDDVSQLESHESLNIASDYEHIGIEHNKILETFLVANKNLNNSNDKKNYVREFIINELDTDVETLEILQSELGTYITSVDGQESFYPKNLQGIDPLAKSFLDEYHEIFFENHIHKSNFSEEKFITNKISQIEEFELKVETSDLDNKWRSVIFASTNVGKSSLEYWEENLLEWKSNINNNQIFLKKCDHSGCYTDDVIDIAGADVAGAATGATYALIVNVMPGPGQVAYGSAIVGTAVSASVGLAVKKIWDWAWS